MSPEAERRRLVFSNLANGVSVEQLMVAFRLSAKEVLDDFAFVAAKIRSYRFERGQPFLPVDTVENVRAQRPALLFTLSRLNLDKPAVFSKIVALELGDGSGRSPAEQKIMEINARRLGR